MSKIYGQKQNKFLISKKKPFTINYRFQTTFSFNMDQNNYLMKKTPAKVKLISNKNRETCFASLNHNKESKEVQKERRKDLKIKFKVNQETELIKNKFITKRIQKNSERWNKKEKILFLKGLYRFGCDWKVIKKYIKSRSSIQVRSHAQKFLLRLRKFKDDSLGIDFTKDSDNNPQEIIQKLKEIIDNSKNENIFHILIEKLSRKKRKNGKTEAFNYNKLTNISDSTSKKNNFDINIFNEDNNNNVDETNYNSIKTEINISEMDKEINKEHERNTITKDYDINHYYGINSMIPNSIFLNDDKYFKNNKVNSYDDISLSEENEINGINKLLDAFEKEEIKYYWNFNDKINLFENEIPENIEKVFEKFT